MSSTVETGGFQPTCRPYYKFVSSGHARVRRISMPMRMVKIGHVRVSMPTRYVSVRMAMLPGRHWVVRVVMMSIVMRVGMLVLHGLVLMFMTMQFHQVDDHADQHERSAKQ